jgi:hypothetical protein
MPPYHPEFNLIQIIWTAVKKWATDWNVIFRMENLMKHADCKFASINKYHWKLRCNYVIVIEAQYITAGVLLDEGQEIAVRVGNENSDDDSSLDMSKDGDDGACEHDAELH